MLIFEPAVREYTSKDLFNYGRRCGLDYQFPSLAFPQDQVILSGTVHELVLRTGIQLVISDVEVIQHYQSRSHAASPLSMIIILEGQVELHLEDEQPVMLTPGMALSVQLVPWRSLIATQAADQRLRVLSLYFDEPCMKLLGINTWAHKGSDHHYWKLPTPLHHYLEHMREANFTTQKSQDLAFEGVALQLLAYGIQLNTPPSSLLSHQNSKELLRLERVRERLRHDPAGEHSLSSLAQLAAMSPASLRRKFKAAFGYSVFEYVRINRLAVAHDYLKRGFSIQQAAHFSGYRHASNFTTAFRRYFGYLPSTLQLQNDQIK